MASIVGNKVKLNNGQLVTPKNGEWYDGQQYWDNTLSAKNQINSKSNQQGAGQQVSREVVSQSGQKNVDYIFGGGGSSGSSGSGSNPNLSPLDQVNQTIQDSFVKLQDEVRKRFGEYNSGKPFKVDEVLANKRLAAKEQIDPFYDQQLGDYLLGVQRKIDRGANDTRDLLTELTASAESYEGAARNTLEAATRQAEQGFADNGLLNSGEALAAEGALKENTGSTLDDYMRKTNMQKKNLITANNRNIEDVTLGKKDFVSNLERNRFTDVESRASSLTKEAGQDYIRGFQQTLPTQLQTASGFDMLKSLGIYS